MNFTPTTIGVFFMRTATSKYGPQPLPRRRINPALRRTIYDSRHPMFQLAAEVGFVHQSQFSAFINSALIPNSAKNIARLYRIADAVGFDRAQLFLDGAR